MRDQADTRALPLPGSTPSLAVPPLCPGYEPLALLGRGGMATVWRARETAGNRRIVALKVMPPSSTAYPDLILRFEREARMLAALHHPNIVQVLDRGCVGDTYYIVMEYVEGKNLQVLMNEGLLDLGDIIGIVSRVGEAVQFCHDSGLLHRDLKPSNVILSSGGGVKVMDFGISCSTHRMGDITEAGVMIGTPQYIAPEQLKNGSEIDERADQFSLAVITYELLTNMLPVGAFPRVCSLRSDVPGEVDEVLRKALATKASDRFASVRAFVQALRWAFCVTQTHPSESTNP